MASCYCSTRAFSSFSSRTTRASELINNQNFGSKNSLILPKFSRNNLFENSERLKNITNNNNRYDKFIVPRSGIDILPPPIDNDLLDTMEEYGAIISEDGVVNTFQNDREALHAARNEIAIFDMSNFGRIRVTGDDRIRFLHNQSTANFQILKEGQGCDTVFVTPVGRTIDLATAIITKNSVILFVSPEKRLSLTTMLQKYIFFADKVEIQDITERTSLLLLVGPKSDELMKKLNLEETVEKPIGHHSIFNFMGIPVTVGVGNFITQGIKNYFFLCSSDSSEKIWLKIFNSGAIPMGADAWEVLRVTDGRPAPDKELVNEYNPLEAGLWKTISITKGCYIGQETIARLITYNGVKKELWGLKLCKDIQEGTKIYSGEKVIGNLTSCVYDQDSSSFFGLGYIRIEFAKEGIEVMIDDSIAIVTSVPFLTRVLETS